MGAEGRSVRAAKCAGLAVLPGLWLVACGSRDIQLGVPPSAEGHFRFAEPVPVAGLGADDADDDDPSLSEDLRLLVFNSERPGGAGKEDLWLAERGRVDGPWSAPRPLVALNSEERETGVALSRDGLRLLFSSDRAGATGLDVYESVRASRFDEFGPPRRVPELSSAGDDLVSALSEDLRTVYLALRSAGSDYTLYTATRTDADAPFAAPRPLVGLDDEGAKSDAFPVATPAALLFTRDADLFIALLRGVGYEPALPLAELDGEGDDRDAWATRDLSYVVFSSDRDGRYRLYETRRVAP